MRFKSRNRQKNHGGGEQQGRAEQGVLKAGGVCFSGVRVPALGDKTHAQQGKNEANNNAVERLMLGREGIHRDSQVNYREIQFTRARRLLEGPRRAFV